MSNKLQVIFETTTEFDLVFEYLDRQAEVLEAQGQPMLPYKILLGDTNTIVEFTVAEGDDNPLRLGDG